MPRPPLPSLRQDRVFAGALILLAVAAFSSLLPGRAALVAHPLAIGAALLAVLVRPDGEAAGARTFWRLIGVGLAFFFAAQLWQLAAARGLLPPVMSRRFELLYVGRYLFLVMALELRADLLGPGGSKAELRRLDTFGAVLFLFSLIAYVVVSPLGGVEVADPRFSPRALYLVLDVFLVLRALALRAQTRSPFWRGVYGWLGVVIVLRGVATLVSASRGAGAGVPLGSVPIQGPAWFVPLVPLILAARLRSDEEEPSASPERVAAAGARLAPLVAYAFAFPIFHFLMEWMGIVDDETGGPRELVLLGFLGAAAVLLWVYQRVLIRENRRLEDEREAMAEQAAEARRMDGLGRLAGGVAHDFNNVLTVIRGRTELLLAEHATRPEAREDLEAIREAARRGESVTRQLLAFGRRQLLRPEVLDVGRIVCDMTPLLRSAVSDEVKLSVTVRDSAPLIVADQGQLEMALLNLAVNAREAMPAGGVLALDVDCVQLDAPAAAEIPPLKPGRHVVLTVRDSGRGMDDATLERIFDPFFTTKPFGSGAGLGLPAAHGFVRQSGGAVTVQSAPGKGATFRIYLPRVEATPQEPGR